MAWYVVQIDDYDSKMPAKYFCYISLAKNVDKTHWISWGQLYWQCMFDLVQTEAVCICLKITH